MGRPNELLIRCFRFTPLWMIAVLVAAIIGCGPKSDRRAISGEVTLDGAPLDGGTIRFSSLDTKNPAAAGAMINSGQYAVPQEKGLVPGRYHLEIYAPDNAAKPVMYRATPGGEGVLTQPERIPAEFNVESNKSIEVTADGDNRFDFTIASQQAK